MADEITRRAVIVSAAIVPVAALTATAQIPASALSDMQLRLLAAFTDRIIPKDDLGPSASESGVPEYINRALGDYLAGEKPAFIEALEATDAFARRSQSRPFIELPSDKQDVVLTAMDSGTAEGFANARAFFNRARRLTMEGMFGDPYYGGNKNFAGWDLIRYPGPRMATSAADQKMGVEIKPYHHSAYGNGQDHGH
ncbi:MAG TPA: gluconate 2-dehydrogenase subunit 3 family protein [Bryobacteraceae bacterium]|jgi:gluconate 2-dehydrogenase gamma chain|nr:gluconate 2-dehydrogenase subunit 3 family protein [Bryobacteraceae bacterium]